MGNTIAKLRVKRLCKKCYLCLEVTGAKVVRRNQYSDITNGASQMQPIML